MTSLPAVPLTPLSVPNVDLHPVPRDQRASASTAAARNRVLASALVVMLLGAATLLLGLGRYPLWEPDEARHAQIAHEIVERGTWLLPTFRGHPYLRKPILYYWLTAAAYEVGGVQTAAARSVSAIAGLLTLLAVFTWANRAWGLRAAILSALVLLTTIEFVTLGRYGDLNMLLTLWVTVGMLGLHRWVTREGRGPGLLVAAAACGLGALTKGLVAPVLVVAVGLLYLWLVGRLHLLRGAQAAGAAALFAAVAVPWYVVAGLSSPGYLRELFVQQQFHRVVGGGPGLHPEPSYFTLAAAVVAFAPWTLLLPAVLQRAGRDRRDDATRFCLLWAVVVVVAFTLPSGKLATYVLPAMPALALVVGGYASRLFRHEPIGREARLLRGGIGALASLAIAAPPIALATTGRLAGGAWLPLARLSVVLCPFGAVLGWVAARRRWSWAAPTIVVAVLCTCAVFYAWGAPFVSDIVSDAQMASAIEAADPSRQAPVVAFRTFGGSLPFYLDRPVHFVVSAGRVRNLLKRRPLVFVVTHHRHVRAFRRIPNLYVWRRARHLLVASRPPPFGPGGQIVPPSRLNRVPAAPLLSYSPRPYFPSRDLR